MLQILILPYMNLIHWIQLRIFRYCHKYIYHYPEDFETCKRKKLCKFRTEVLINHYSDLENWYFNKYERT